jgi:dihydroflavonol-4-reductase
MSQRILITGATGFLGRHLVEHLLASDPGAELRILNFGPCPFEPSERLEIVEGDVTRPEDVERAVAGCTRIYHLAGVVSRNPRDKWKIFDVNVDGTRHVCRAALAHKVERMVLVSSSGTVAVSKEPVVHNEDGGFKIEVVGRWPYYLSKIYAEKVALDLFRRYGLPVVIANPGLLYGPGDEFGSSTRDLALLLEGRLPAIPSGGMCFVDARDAAGGLIAAMQAGRPGERYLLGGPNWTFRQIIARVAEIARVRPPMFELPLGFSLWSARVLRRLLPLVGRNFPLDDTTIEMAAHFWYADSTKAATELGFRARDPMETLRDTVADLRERAARGRLRQ